MRPQRSWIARSALARRSPLRILSGAFKPEVLVDASGFSLFVEMRPQRSWTMRSALARRAQIQILSGAWNPLEYHLIFQGILVFAIRQVIDSLLDSSYLFQPFLSFSFVFIESVTVDIQRRTGLGVSQQPSHRPHINSLRDQQAGVSVAKAVNI